MPPKTASSSNPGRHPRVSTAPRQSVASGPIRSGGPPSQSSRGGTASSSSSSRAPKPSTSLASSPATPKTAKQRKSDAFDSPAFVDDLDADDSGLLTLKPNHSELAAMSLADSPSPRKQKPPAARAGARPSWGPQPATARSNLRFLRDLDEEPVSALRSRVSIFAKHSLVSTANEGVGDDTVLRSPRAAATEGLSSFMHELGGEELPAEPPHSPPQVVDQAAPSEEIATNPGQEESEAYVEQQLHQLKRMNEVFESYEGMLRGSLSQIGLFADRIDNTDALLDKYIDLLRQAEKTQTLLLDSEWKGASEDAAAHALSVELAERAKREADARAAALAEEAAHRAKAAAAEASKRARAAEVEEERRRRGGPSVRARGTGLTRNTAAANGRNATRGGSNARGRPMVQQQSRIPSQSTSEGGPGSRAASHAVSGASGGLGGRYAEVRSSGYGPR